MSCHQYWVQHIGSASHDANLNVKQGELALLTVTALQHVSSVC